MFIRSVYEYYGMPTSEYLETPKGQYGRYQWRRRKGLSYYSFNIEPKSKKSMKIHEKMNFQQKISKRMTQRSRKSYRSEIIAELSITPSANNPPHIHTAVKNLLDLFGKPMQDSGIKRKGLVYNDDKQIRYLSAEYHLGQEEPCIRSSFYPLRYFLEDLKLANDILDGKYNDYFSYISLMQDIKEFYGTRNLDDVHDDTVLDYKQWVKNRSKYIGLFGEKTYEKMIQLYKMQLQEYFFKTCRLYIKDVYLLYRLAGLISNSRFERLGLEQFEEWARNQSDSLSKWITHSPLKIKLPHTPITVGDTKRFKVAIQKKLNDYKKKYEILQPLYNPIALEVIYKPPLASDGFYKDLDNIMRLILPIFNNEFKPPPSFLSLCNTDDIPDEDMIAGIKRRSQLLPKSIKHSVIKYEIFEIPRHRNDTEEGFISIGITGGLSCLDTLWCRMDKIIEKWKEHCDTC